ncbi:flagellar motor switch protein FliN [Nocardioides sp. URHA0020]|uniref:flagellar motor switch protein FliN n=1 Tax=Nocardioides sp. URHA0020 TaxID=1380392 RepID=UPI00048AD833|nr:flagellar motor switch protein FliN [Nocardioides sp. URHA0020]
MTTKNTAAELVLSTAAAAGAAVLPSNEPLTVGTIAPGDPKIAGPFAGAVIADLDAAVPGRIAVLVGQELVAALAESPLGGLDLAAALQPTLDAVASALHGRVGAAREVALGEVDRDVTSPFSVAFLNATSVAAAVLVPDNVLAGAHNVELSAEAIALDGPDDAAPGNVLSSVGHLDPTTRSTPGIELLHGVDMEVTVEIGRTRMTVRDLLDLTPGAVLELDRAAGSPADLLVNGRLIARGEVVVIDEDFGLRITEIAVDAAAS